ncbi:hypothetical protein MWN34_09065 [Ancylobacter sp. 6x-1]|uniref:Uncharacterized protein n=1 Tax=Ancylobacter crimeensis TaxID=2579147 RepID=A0ABT0DAS6_9HYPH|nr:hypothetical protein [Ancylobacter crimeensis]MCK0197061.1 hypothetical protein [Ancylobacter crimeensis]
MQAINAFPFPFSPTPYGCRLEDIPDDIVTGDGWKPLDAVNLDHLPPPGWYTVGHWSALTEPGIFRLLSGPLHEALADMEAQAVAASRREGIEPIDWPAPPALVAIGIETVKLIPEIVLRDITRG